MKKRFLTLLLATMILAGCTKQEPKKKEPKQEEVKKEEPKKEEPKQQKSEKFNVEEVNETKVDKKISLKNVDITITVFAKHKYTFLDDSFLKTVKSESKNDLEIQKATLNNPIGECTLYIKFKNKIDKEINWGGKIIMESIYPNAGDNNFNNFPITFYNLSPNKEKTYSFSYFFPLEDLEKIKHIKLLMASVFQTNPVQELEEIKTIEFDVN